MTIIEHTKWAKERAAEQAEETSWVAGWISFKHDMLKHDEIRDNPTYQFLFELGDDVGKEAIRFTMLIGSPDPFVEDKLRRFIEDFAG